METNCNERLGTSLRVRNAKIPQNSKNHASDAQYRKRSPEGSMIQKYSDEWDREDSTRRKRVVEQSHQLCNLFRVSEKVLQLIVSGGNVKIHP